VFQKNAKSDKKIKKDETCVRKVSKRLKCVLKKRKKCQKVLKRSNVSLSCDTLFVFFVALYFYRVVGV
jgi:hypothetical protein